MEFLGGDPVKPAVENMPTTAPKQRTAIVLGVPKGGTSMVGAVLDAMGVYVGEQADIQRAGAFENPALMSDNGAVHIAEVKRCNEAYNVWGFKNPNGASVLRWLPASIRNPYALMIFRDPVAVAQRWQIRYSDTRPFPAILEEVCENYRALLVIAGGGPPWPRLWISYERAKTDPAEFVQSVSEFLGLDPTTRQTIEAIRRVSFKGGYLIQGPEALLTLRPAALAALSPNLAQTVEAIQQGRELKK